MHITVEQLQAYLHQHYSPWANEQGLFMKLVEEMGEVAEILNKRSGRKASEEDDLSQALTEELADMLHYIVAIAAVNGLNLEDMILEKDQKASVKYHREVNLQQFLEQKHT
ncbi:MAG: nucleotide pyrophosphohydrolase [Oscillospiraceae bacterium]|nr:nucleotide pyrophosphohydrolase [Oscillospiraceae bacterium]